MTCNLIGRSADDAAGIDVWDTGVLSSGNASTDGRGQHVRRLARRHHRCRQPHRRRLRRGRPGGQRVRHRHLDRVGELDARRPLCPTHRSADGSWSPRTGTPSTCRWRPRRTTLTDLTAGAAQTAPGTCGQRRGCRWHRDGRLHHRSVAHRAGRGQRDRRVQPSVQGLQLGWNPADGATSYDVIVGGVLTSVTTPSMVVTGLTPNTPYLVTVSGHNDQGAGAAGVAMAVTSPAQDTTTHLTFSASGTTVTYHGERHLHGDGQAGTSPWPARTSACSATCPVTCGLPSRTLATSAQGVAALTLTDSATAYYRVLTVDQPGCRQRVDQGQRALRRHRPTLGLDREAERSASPSPARSHRSSAVLGSCPAQGRRQVGRWLTHTFVSSKSHYSANVKLTSRGDLAIRVLVAPRSDYSPGSAPPTR